MTSQKWLTLIGGGILILGLFTAFISSQYTSKVMGGARLGVAVLAPEPNSPEWQEKQTLLWWADFWFYVGLGLTAVGVILQTVCAIWPLDRTQAKTMERAQLRGARKIDLPDD
jgi:hypothetical protein